MDTSTVRALLPCHVCGDLPPDIGAQVEAALRRHPELQAEADALRSSRRACLEALRAVDPLPDLPSFEDTLTPVPVLHLPDDEPEAPPRPPRASPAERAWAGLFLGVAAALLLLLGLEHRARPLPGAGILAEHAAWAEPGAALVRTSDPVALARALREAGVPQHSFRVPDLSAMGMQLVGGAAVAAERGLGAVVVYERDGQRFVCEFAAHVPAGPTPDLAVRVANRDLLAFETFHRDRAVVVWRDGGLFCLFSGPMAASELLTMVSARLEGMHG